MKQTAVEWHYIELSKFINGKSEFTHKNDIFIKAKEMEKEQRMEAWCNGYDSYDEDISGDSPLEYYNKTFNINEK